MIYRSPFKEKSRQTTAFRKEGDWKLGYHTGVDRVCDTDRTLVAICDGVVTRTSGCGKSYGNHIVYRTDDGRCVLYAHMKDKTELPVGAKIKAGQKLGTMGNTGNSTGAHTHLEIRPAGSTSASIDITEFTGIPNIKGVYYYNPNTEKSEDDGNLQSFERLIAEYFDNLRNKAPSEWSADSRAFVEKNGLFIGDDKGEFAYKSFVTREELAVIVQRVVTGIMDNIKT